MKSRIAGMALLFVTVLLSGCLGPTPYQVRGATGGYQERSVGEDRWYVEFYGNGFTSRDTVFAYWLHRCAELTIEKGFDYFVMLSKTPPATPAAALEIEGLPAAASEDAEMMRAKGGGGGAVPIYIPGGGGGGAVRWSARSVIQLHKGTPGFDETAFVAKEVVAKLGPAVRQANQTGANVVLPAEFRQTTPASASEPGAGKQDGIGIDMDDLKDLLPKE